MKIFLLTDHIGLREDDKILVDALKKKNCNIVIADWEEVNLQGPCNVLIRTPWNYSEKIEKFLKLITSVEASGGRILHRSEILMWNAHKSYLQNCDSAVETKVEVLNQDTPLDYPVVIKPVYGAGGKNTYCVKNHQSYLKLSPHFGEHFLVQPYMESIKTEGEYSFIFFEHNFSHAVLKKVKGEEFRIQDEFGGTVERYLPNKREIRDVQKILNSFPHRFEFARVDFVKEGDEIKIMELEVIEPELFFRFFPEGAMTFAETICEYFES